MMYQSYVAVMQRVSDGEIRRRHMDTGWDTDTDGSWFFWDEGNFGCDCNRYLEFERAAGHNPPRDGDYPCGDTRYRVLAFEFPDGSSIPGPDVDAPTPRS